MKKSADYGKPDEKSADVARAEAAQRATLITSAGDAGAVVPDRARVVPESDAARKLKIALGIPPKHASEPAAPENI